MSAASTGSASAQAAASLRKLIDDKDIPDAVRKAMAPEFAAGCRVLYWYIDPLYLIQAALGASGLLTV